MPLAGLRALGAGSWSREKLRDFQARRLRALVQHAYDRVPYYRDLFDRARLAPADIQTLDDLLRIPTSQKNDFSERPETEVVARGVNPRRIITYPTGGSTGIPMIVRCTRSESRLLQMFRMQAMMQLGLRVRDRRSFVTIIRGRDQSGPLQRLGLFPIRKTNAVWPSDRILADLRAWKPDVIRGYPSTLSSLAAELTDADRAAILPRCLVTDSENLMPHMRLQIETGFRAPVFDFYDCFECNVIARQCATGNQYHVLDAAVIVEIVRDGKPVRPGETGEVVITPLHSWASPLIRYRIGDLAVRGADRCACGAGHSCIARVEGRVQDAIALADGRLIASHVFIGPITPLYPNLRRYQIVQKAIDQIVITLQPIPGEPPSRARLDAFAATIRQNLGEAIRLDVELVDDIPSEPNGKFRTFRNLWR